MNTQFEGMLDHYFEGLLEAHPMYATSVGLKFGEGKLDTATLEFEGQQHKRRLATLTQLESISLRDLNNEQQLDRLALRSMLLRENEEFERGRNGLEPDAPEQVLNALLHELIRGDDKPARAARNIRGLVDQTTRFLEEAATLVDKPEPVWLKIMQQTMDGADALFSAVATFLARHKAEAPDSKRVDSAKQAFSKYRRRVEARRPAPAGSFAIGPDAMQRRVRDQLERLGSCQSYGK